MSADTWLSSNNALEMLESYKAYDEKCFLNTVNQLQVYYILCCKKQLSLLPQREFQEGLESAEKFVRNEISKEELNRQNWKTEGAVFGMDYDTSSEINDSIYKNIAISKEITEEEAKNFAVSYGYFIDWTMLYACSFNGRIPYKYELFLDADILRESIKCPFPN